MPPRAGAEELAREVSEFAEEAKDEVRHESLFTQLEVLTGDIDDLVGRDKLRGAIACRLRASLVALCLRLARSTAAGTLRAGPHEPCFNVTFSALECFVARSHEVSRETRIHSLRETVEER